MNRIQLLAGILKRADELLKGDVNVTPLEHQMHTRIFNNSFCNLLKEGVYARENENEILLVINKQQYFCPKQVAENILRDEYEPALARCGEIDCPFVRTDTEGFSSVFGIDGKDIEDINADDFLLPEIFGGAVDVVEINDGENETEIKAHPDDMPEEEIKGGKILRFRPKTITGNYCEPVTETEEEEDDSLLCYSGEGGHEKYEAAKEDDERMAFVPKDEKPAEEETEEDSHTGFFPRGRNRAKHGGMGSFTEPKEERPARLGVFHLGRHRREITEESMEEGGPSRQGESNVPAVFKPKTPVIEEQRPKVDIADISYEMPGAVVYEKKEKSDHSQDAGELFMHRHVVTLSKSYGNDRVGPFRFTFWPTSIPDSTDRQFADMLVHVIDDTAKTEQLYICDRDNPELSLVFDKKNLKVFGIWEDGEFNAHITLQGQTASMFTINDDVVKKEPEVLNEYFLDQFRLERKGQPKHFVVPFKDGNHGEETIPIVGMVEIRNRRYALRRMDGNTIQYKMDNKQRVVTGRWEDGKFAIRIENRQPE